MQQDLKIKHLLSLFDSANTSYKFLFFYALIKIIKKNNLKKIITFKEIINEMLISAWLPCFQFNLNFRIQDQTKELLIDVTKNVPESVKINKPTNKIISKIYKIIKEILNDDKNLQLTQKKLLSYVVVRLIRPFYKRLKNMPESGKISIFRTSNKVLKKDYKKEQPPYLINFEKTEIILNRKWSRYIYEHYHFLELWVLDEWYKYMKQQNKNSPSLYEKLKFPDFHRNSLNKQRKFWEKIVNNHEIRCIFTNEILTEDNFDIDHFICWNFLAHDEEWNLIPILSEINRSKKNKMPNHQLVEPFVNFKIKSFKYAKEILHEKKYIEYLFEHSNFINFTYKNCFTDNFKLKYIDEIRLLLNKARNQGFENFEKE